MSVTAAAGFVASGVACGVKPSGDRDLALVATADGRPVPAAAVFTSNKMTAAPVIVSAAHLTASGGHATATVAQQRCNANAANGEAGRQHAEQMGAAVADGLGCVGRRMCWSARPGSSGSRCRSNRSSRGNPGLVGGRRRDGQTDAAEAMRTTDTHRKESVSRKGGLVVGGMAKGAAMLAPNMATMLALYSPDRRRAPRRELLAAALRAGVESSFNALVVDGCTSTNDTVILLASGRGRACQTARPRFICSRSPRCVGRPRQAQMAGDAEGATKVVRLTVRRRDQRCPGTSGAPAPSPPAS